MQNTKEFLKQLLDTDSAVTLNGHCHDCKCEVNGTAYHDDKGYWTDIPFWFFEEAGPFCKCESCYEVEPRLTNYQPIEVFTRTVGYIRPVKQFNPGKKAEWKDRVFFKVDEADYQEGGRYHE